MSMSLLRFNLCELGERLGELALFASSGILVNDTLSYTLVDLLNCFAVDSGSSFLVAFFESNIVLADGSVESRLEHSVLKVLLLAYANALFRGLNVRHCLFLL